MGADIDQARRDGTTSLMLAARRDNTALVQCLIQLGAELDAKDICGDIVVLVSGLYGRFRMLQYLLEEFNKRVPIWMTSTTMHRQSGMCS
jgi:ankyrin repeat protein